MLTEELQATAEIPTQTENDDGSTPSTSKRPRVSNGAYQSEPITNQNFSKIAPLIDSQKCLVVTLTKVNSLEKEMNIIKTQFTNMEKEILDIKKIVTKISEKLFPPEDEQLDIDCPIKTQEDLDDIEKRLSEISVYASFKKQMEKLIGGDVKRNVSHVFSDELLIKFNWNGKKGQLSLKSYKNITTAIFESIKLDSYTFPQYERDMKAAIRVSHGRIHVQKFRERQIEKELSKSIDFILEEASI